MQNNPISLKKAIFVDRDGTIIVEPSPELNEQVDSLEKLSFVPGAISGLKAMSGLGFEIVLASNQDGLGSASYPWETFWPAHNKMRETLAGEGVRFDDELIDPTMPEEHAPTRKPGTGMFGKYLSGDYDLSASFVIGDRDTDGQLAENLGARFLRIDPSRQAACWAEAVETVRRSERRAVIRRKTAETDIAVTLDLDGIGPSSVQTGLGFFDHMLTQLIHHGGLALELSCQGDLNVDEHHTMEDVALALGEAVRTALGDKRGIERYGFALPMDESAALVLLDFGGRSELVWDVSFTREYVGDVPTEMFRHFFKSFCDAARCNLRVEAKVENNHHLAEAVFKAFARSLRQAVRRNVFDAALPSSKGIL
ncbi:MAG: bifunctional histidinol-phosphatase/imidazoleglycerol-phosphate dehydratase HisB [Bacteroidales bacterium]|nr:bifunctional histidinol-phosphatase/imidazoleglycerol-phosphate dehydratase HisB [Bacteroidales bacterium]